MTPNPPPSQTAVDPLQGRVLDGRYRVESFLARGGMATIYRGADLRLERTVAIKVMHPTFATDPGFVDRFEREARAAARLNSQYAVGVHDQGNDAGVTYLVMEYVPGHTVRDVLRAHGPLPPAQALAIVDPVLQALAAAHRAGYVHRDIKPENVLISEDGRVKVTDFGLARAIEGADSGKTNGLLLGTVAYLSPEQVEHDHTDARSDVYSTGILLFELITGQVPFTASAPMQVAYRHVHEDVPAPSSVRAGIPAGIDALVLEATRRRPEERFGDADAFLAAVRTQRAALPPAQPWTPSPTDTLIVTREPGTGGTAKQAAAGAAALGAAAVGGAGAGASVPMWITVNILGNPDNGVILVSYIGSFLMAGAFLAIGSAISALTKNQVIAFIISATLCFLLVMSGLELVLNVLRAWTPSFLVSAVASMSFLSHFDRVTRGVLDLSGLVFYLSLIAFALFANRIFVELKKAD